jgi:hypothetical protein
VSTRHVRRQRDAQRVGIDSPAALDALWGTVLPIPAGPGAGDDFEARVQRAWEHLKGGYFTADEHDQLREVLGAVIAKEFMTAAPPRGLRS